MALPKPKLRIRSYTENDVRSFSPTTITPNDIFASPTARIKSYYERRTKVQESDVKPKVPTVATPNDRVVMIVHAPDHDPVSNDSMFQNGIFDWSGRGNHIDYHPDERVELEEIELLGHGTNSSVYRTTCKRVALAWKRIYCRRPIDLAQRKEIERIKRLDHHHVMRLVGTYTSKSFLGVLLWPVAACDLSALMKDLDHYLDPSALTKELDLRDEERGARLDAIMGHGMTSSVQRSAILPLLQRRLLRCFGCLASALAYLHAQGIRHKNLNPSNVLLSFNGLWLTDFETSTELPENLCTATKSDDRDTAKYFAYVYLKFKRAWSQSKSSKEYVTERLNRGAGFANLLKLVLGLQVEVNPFSEYFKFKLLISTLRLTFEFEEFKNPALYLVSLPEIARSEPSGMAADIFSLGAIYLEMIGLCDNKRLRVMSDLRPEKDHSFQANLSRSQTWLDTLSPATHETDGDLLNLISEMLLYDPEKRPNAIVVNARLSIYTPDLAQHPREGTYSLRYYDTCCRHIYLGPKEEFYNDAQWTRHQAPPKADWLIRKQDKKAFDTLFSKIDAKRTGSIDKTQVMASFSIWGLPDETLLKIWKLSAIQQGDQLDRDEFAVAMFLIRTQCGSTKSLPSKIPQKLIPPSLRPQLHTKEDAPRGYLYNCPKTDCPFQLEKGLTGPEQLTQHLAVFHVDLASRRRADSLKKLGQLSPTVKGENARPPRLEDSRARMEDAMKGRGRVEPTRLSLLEQARLRKRGATISEMEVLREIVEQP